MAPFLIGWRHVPLAHIIALALTPSAIVHAEPLAYVTNQGSLDVAVINMCAQQIVDTQAAGDCPAGIDVAPDASKRQLAGHEPYP